MGPYHLIRTTNIIDMFNRYHMPCMQVCRVNVRMIEREFGGKRASNIHVTTTIRLVSD